MSLGGDCSVTKVGRIAESFHSCGITVIRAGGALLRGSILRVSELATRA